ncbi:hypothetical protein [Legionella clemsonensis]|nr:hypothetical protein [Legionella clemsonensis]
MAAIEALFKKNDKEARHIQARLLKKWAKEQTINIPQNDNIVWNAIRRNSCNTIYRWYGLVLLARKKGISLNLPDHLLTHSLTACQKLEGERSVQKIALDFLSCFAVTANTEQLQILINAVAAQSHWPFKFSILKRIEAVIPQETLNTFVQESIKFVKNDASPLIPDEEDCFMRHYLPRVNKQEASELLQFILNEEACETHEQQYVVLRKKLQALSYIAKQLSQTDLGLAFDFVYKNLDSTLSIPSLYYPSTIKDIAWSILRTFMPRLNQKQLAQVIVKINSMLNKDSSLLSLVDAACILWRLTNRTNVLSTHPSFPKIISNLQLLVDANFQDSRLLTIFFDILPLIASYIDEERRQSALKTIKKAITGEILDYSNSYLVTGILAALSSFSNYLNEEQVNEFFSIAKNFRDSNYEFALKIFIALAKVLDSAKINEVIALITSKEKSNYITGLQFQFLTNAAHQLEKQHLEIVKQFILENSSYPLVMRDEHQIFLRAMDQNDLQIILDKAIKLLEPKEDTQCVSTWDIRAALSRINILSSYLSKKQIQQSVEKINPIISQNFKKLEGAEIKLYLEYIMLVFDRGDLKIQASMIQNLLHMYRNHGSYSVRNALINTLTCFIVRGNIKQEDIKDKLPELENKFINCFLNLYDQIKQAETLPQIKLTL